MARWSTHRTDGNADRLRQYLEAHGFQVDVIDRPLDWIVSGCGLSAVCEVKTPRGNLRASQKAFLDNCKGLTAVLRDEADCDGLMRRLRKMGGKTLVDRLAPWI